jgi:hypothetical protein
MRMLGYEYTSFVNPNLLRDPVKMGDEKGHYHKVFSINEK